MEKPSERGEGASYMSLAKSKPAISVKQIPPAKEKPRDAEVRTKSASARKTSKSGMIRARVNPKLKNDAEKILARLGLNASDAVRLFYQQVIIQKGLPFEVRIPNAETRKALRDAEAGKNMSRYKSVEAMFEDLLR